MLSTDKLYDNYGNLQKVSQPFPGSAATLWSTYAYDTYDRPTSITEPSGRITTHSYSGNSVTTVEDKISTTRRYDAQSNLLSVTDPAGTITYNLRPDGQPYSIVAPGNVTTSLEYDPMGRRTSLTDPSYGVTSYSYDASGNMLKETDADNRVINYSYDGYNRVSTVTTPEFVTTYSYNAHDELIGESTNNGTSKTFTYDDIGRLSTWKESVVDNKWLQKEFTYVGGNVSSIKYSSQSGSLTTENYTYANGYLSEIKLSDQTSIYKLSKENDLGLPSEIVTGNTTRNYDYNAYGLPTGRRSKTTASTFQNFGYTFDVTTSNLTSRKDNGRNLSESFGYDNLNRLTSYSGKTATFDVKGNVTQKSDAGTFGYTRTDKPYAISEATISGNSIPVRSQNVTYNSFKRPNTISENGYAAAFTYNGQYDRVKMNLTKNGTRQLTRYYLGGCYELDETSTGLKKEKLYLGGDFYNASSVYVKEDLGSGQLYAIYRDYLGSITHITNASGAVVQELSYDAWGRLRNPSNQVVYAPDQEPVLFLGRGYTGHEHLPQFGLVNMNARLYDPVLGRFLSADPYVQAPDFSQSFNRYAYAMNNPLKFVDENGEFIHIIIGGFAAGMINLVYKTANGQIHSFTDGLMAFGIGAAAGALGAATGGIAFAAAGGAAGGIGGFLAGAAAGGAGSAASMAVQSGGNTLYFGDPFISPENFALGVLGGTITGGIGNGAIAAMKGNNFWTGKDVKFGRGRFSFNNTPTRPGPEMKHLEGSSSYLKVEQPNIRALADEKIGRIIPANEADTYSVYQGVDKQDQVRYIGITKRAPEVRFTEHANSNTNRSSLKFEKMENTGKLSRGQARIMEQTLINKHGLSKDAGTLYNKMNSISPKYWKGLGIKK